MLVTPECFLVMGYHSPRALAILYCSIIYLFFFFFFTFSFYVTLVAVTYSFLSLIVELFFSDLKISHLLFLQILLFF